ncbi:MAG: hypothetical protein KC421_08440 [Anaerolineales bacterium]|nr:hypothetical protein [Anaerolineales bacterium]
MQSNILKNTTDSLMQGAILGTIAHGIWVAQYPEMAALQSWDDTNYCIQDYSGAYGTISFSEIGTVGVFFDSHRWKKTISRIPNYSPQSFFVGTPKPLWNLAKNETLQYMLRDFSGSVQPLITAAFWSEDKNLCASKPWNLVFENGAHLIANHLLDIDASFLYWTDFYELSESQLSLLKIIFSKKMNTSTLVELSSDEKFALMDGAKDFNLCRKIFLSIGISLP